MAKPRYRGRTAAGDPGWLQVVGRDETGSYYLVTITGPTHEDPDWHVGDSAFARWRTEARFDFRIDPPLLRQAAGAAFWAAAAFAGANENSGVIAVADAASTLPSQAVLLLMRRSRLSGLSVDKSLPVNRCGS